MKQNILSIAAIVLSLIAIVVSVTKSEQKQFNDTLEKRILDVQQASGDHRKTHSDAIVKLIQDVEALKAASKQ